MLSLFYTKGFSTTGFYLSTNIICSCVKVLVSFVQTFERMKLTSIFFKGNTKMFCVVFYFIFLDMKILIT